MSPDYPDTPAGPFAAPPIEFADQDGRDILIREFEEDDREPLVEMYVGFDPADRAQGIPPSGESAVRGWLETLIDEGINVVAWNDDRAIGHATLVPDGEDAYELAIFVDQDYQSAGIGSRLIAGLLGLGEERGAERVWLTVERWNEPAMRLYRKVGFEENDPGSFELEMAIRLH